MSLFDVFKMIPFARRFFLATQSFFDAFPPRISSLEAPADVRQPGAGARLPHPDGDSGVHLPVPDDRAARLRGAVARVHRGPPLRRAEVPEALYLVLPERGRVPRGSDEPHLRRPREGPPAPLPPA